MKNLKNWFLFSVVVVVWGLNWPIMKIGLEYVTPANLLFQRFLFSTVMMAPILWFIRRDLHGDRGTIVKVITLSVINAFSMFFTMLGLVSESSGVSSIVTYTQPLFVFGLSIIFLKNEVTKLGIIGVLAGFAGIAVIYSGNLNDPSGGLQSAMFLLVGAFLWALTIIFYKVISKTVNPYFFTFCEIAVGSLALLPLVVGHGEFNVVFDMRYVLSMFYSSALASVLAFSLWFYLLRNENATAVASSSLVVPVFAFASSKLILSESINLLQICGVVMVLTGVYLVNSSSTRGISLHR